MTKQSLKEDSRPADLWFWNDWFGSLDVKICSLAAQGLWINMLGIMRQAEVIGTLTIAGRPVDSKRLAKALGASKEEVELLLNELEDNKVFSRLEDGTIINRRMYSESIVSKIRSEAGKKGAESRWQKDAKPQAKHGMVWNNLNLNNIKSQLLANGFSQIDLELTILLIEFMLKNNPDSSIIKHLTLKRLKDWVNETRLLRERDGKSPEQIEAVVQFSQEDDFWKMNILSMPKLREKWDQLFLKAKGRREGAGTSRIGATRPQDRIPIPAKVYHEARELLKKEAQQKGFDEEAMTKRISGFFYNLTKAFKDSCLAEALQGISQDPQALIAFIDKQMKEDSLPE